MSEMKPILWPAVLLALVLAAAGCADEQDDQQPAPQPDPPAACALIPLINEAERTIDLISAPPCTFKLLGGEPRLALEREGQVEWIRPADFPTARASYQETSARWEFSGHAEAPDLTLYISTSSIPQSVTISTQLRGRSATRLAGMGIFFDAAAGGGVSAVGFNGGYNVLHNGHDAWSPTQIERIETGMPAVPRQSGRIKACGNNYHISEDCRGVSWWVGAWSVPGDGQGHGGETLAAGALSAHTWKTYVASESLRLDGRGNLALLQGTPGDQIELAPGDRLMLDPLFLTVAQDHAAALFAYADRAAQVTPPLSWPGERPRGWGSWYYFFEEVTQQDVLDQLPTLSEQYVPAGFDLVQLDDGYMPRWGEWEANEKFPDGLERLAAIVAAYGMTPGIWMAPLLVDVETELYAARPEWFVRGSDGAHLIFGNLGGAQYAYLDVTQPEAADWLKQQIALMVGRGYRYLKLDFLFGGSAEGVRHQSVTSLQAYERALDIIREAAGPDVFLLGCGEPLLPSLGKVHAIRTSTDVVSSAFPHPLHVINANLARINSARFFTSRWFIVDPDNLLVRKPLPEAAAKLAALANVLAHGQLMLGDDLTSLDSERRALLLSPQLLELANATGELVPLDLFDQYTPVLIKNPVEDVLFFNSRPPRLWWLRSGPAAGYLAVFAWQDGPCSVTVRPRQLEAEGRSVELRELYSGETLLLDGEPLTFELQGPDALVFSLSPR